MTDLPHTPGQPYPILIFADGASSGNPGPGGWGTIVARPSGEVTELGGFEPDTTNNRMELAGAIAGLREVQGDPGPVEIYTDSVYVIRGITQWCWGWRKRGWKTAEGKDVVNQDLWQALIALVARRGRENPPEKPTEKTIDWRFVRGHAGIPGNERVDQIAVGFSKGRPPRLFRGPLLQYGVAIHDLPENFDVPERSAKSQEPKAKAYSYLSLIGGKAERHMDWKDCERRVKGQSGAKFKKAMDPADEKAILESWGVKIT